MDGGKGRLLLSFFPFLFPSFSASSVCEGRCVGGSGVGGGRDAANRRRPALLSLPFPPSSFPSPLRAPGASAIEGCRYGGPEH